MAKKRTKQVLTGHTKKFQEDKLLVIAIESRGQLIDPKSEGRTQADYRWKPKELYVMKLKYTPRFFPHNKTWAFVPHLSYVSFGDKIERFTFETSPLELDLNSYKVFWLNRTQYKATNVVRGNLEEKISFFSGDDFVKNYFRNKGKESKLAQIDAYL